MGCDGSRQTVLIVLLQEKTLLQDVLDTSHEVGRTERLGDVVVDAGTQTFELVVGVGQGSKENEGDVAQLGILTHALGQSEAIEARHHDIADDDVGHQFGGFLQAFDAIGCLIYLVLRSEYLTNEPTQFVVVLHDEQGHVGVDRGGFGLGKLDFRTFVAEVVADDEFGVGCEVLTTGVEIDGEAGADVGLAVDGDLSMVQIDKLLCQGQADAGALHARRRMTQLAAEAFEEMLQSFAADAYTIVAYREDSLALGLFDGDADRMTGVGELEGIAQEVAYHLCKLVGVGPDGEGVHLVFVDKVDLHGLGEQTEVVDLTSYEGDEVEVFDRECHLAVLYLSEVENLADEM